MACLDQIRVIFTRDRICDALQGLTALGTPQDDACPIELAFPDRVVTLPFGRKGKPSGRPKPLREDMTRAYSVSLGIQISFDADDVLREQLDDEIEYAPAPDAETKATVTLPFGVSVRPSFKDAPSMAMLIFYTGKHYAWLLGQSESITDTFAYFALEQKAECCCIVNDCGGLGFTLTVKDDVRRVVVGYHFDEYEPLQAELQALEGLPAADATAASINKYLVTPPYPGARTQALRLVNRCCADAALFGGAITNGDEQLRRAAIMELVDRGDKAAVAILESMRPSSKLFRRMIADAIQSIQTGNQMGFRSYWRQPDSQLVSFRRISDRAAPRPHRTERPD